MPPKQAVFIKVTCSQFGGWVWDMCNGPSGSLMSTARPKLPQEVATFSLLSQMLPVLLNSSLQGHGFPRHPILASVDPQGPLLEKKAAVPMLGRRERGQGQECGRNRCRWWVTTPRVGTTGAWAVTRTTSSKWQIRPMPPHLDAPPCSQSACSQGGFRARFPRVFPFRAMHPHSFWGRF